MTSPIQLRPEEVSLLRDLMDYRERSQLAGRYDDEFVVVFTGSSGDLTHGGLAGNRPVSMRTLHRFDALGLLDISSRTDASIVFDLADDYRERWSRLLQTVQEAADAKGERDVLAEADPDMSSTFSPENELQARGVFISCSEHQKAHLALPFQALLAESGVRGFVVSEEPRPAGTWTPEEKVDAYLQASDAVVVFATADIEAGVDRYTRPNIADEIARARSTRHLRDRICVLKESQVTLPSNINPAYESLETRNPQEGFRRAIVQLREWGFPLTAPPESAAFEPTETSDPSRALAGDPARDLAPADDQALLARAKALVPGREHVAGEMSLAMIFVAAPQQSVLRPSELESASLATRVTQDLLFGSAALLNHTEGTSSSMSGNSLVIRQARSWIALDAQGTVVVLRPILREPSRRVGLPAVIDEDIRNDIEEVIRFVCRLLNSLDPAGRLTHVAPVVALVGVNYGAWRTRAEQEASPNSATMNISLASTPIAWLSPAARARAILERDAPAIAEDLTVLLRRDATR